MAATHDPRREADGMVGDAHTGRVLEPSLPAVTDDGSFADDPVACGDVSEDLTVVAPTGAGDLSWDEWAAGDESRMEWARQRWLLTTGCTVAEVVPDGLVRARDRLHLVASNVLTQARFAANGKIGLRWTRGGFGTPFFVDAESGKDTQVRIGAEGLVVQQGNDATSQTLSTLGAARQLALGGQDVRPSWMESLGLDDPPAIGDPADPVDVDSRHISFLGDWFGLGYAVLERLRADEESVAASRPQIWPEHFDPAIEVLAEPRRASYGFSPGDGSSDTPYVYVSVWSPEELAGIEGSQWNADGYVGAVLPYARVAAAPDPVPFVLGWLRERRDVLASAKLTGVTEGETPR